MSKKKKKRIKVTVISNFDQMFVLRTLTKSIRELDSLSFLIVFGL